MLASKPEKYVEDVKILEKADVDWFHIDMLDGTFTGTYAFPPEDLARINAASDFPLPMGCSLVFSPASIMHLYRSSRSLEGQLLVKSPSAAAAS